jgi:hypothetical protein
MALSDEAVQRRERLACMATRVEAVLAALPTPELSPSPAIEDYYAQPPQGLLRTVETDLAQVGPEVQALVTRRSQLEEQRGSLARYEATLRQLLPLVPTLIDLEHYAMTAVWVERRYRAALEMLARQLEELTAGQCEVVSREVDQDALVAMLIFPKRQTGAVNELLGRENIAQLRLPSEFTGQPFEAALANIRRRLWTIPQELAEVDAQQAALAHTWRPRLLTWQALLHGHLAQIDVCTNLGQTDYTFIIEGWIPERRLPELRAALEREVGTEVLVTELPLRPEEQAQAPVMFDNPRLVSPFEPLLRLLALPRYGAFDPTLLLSLFLPLFFGMILGDVAYGSLSGCQGYGYGNARLRARRSRLLTEADYSALLARAHIEDVITALTETPYKDDIEAALLRVRGVGCVFEAVRTNLTRTLHEVREFFAGEPRLLVDLLLRRWDRHNLLTILRGQSREVPAEEVWSAIVPVGQLDEVVLRELARQPGLRAVIDLLTTLAVALC